MFPDLLVHLNHEHPLKRSRSGPGSPSASSSGASGQGDRWADVISLHPGLPKAGRRSDVYPGRDLLRPTFHSKVIAFDRLGKLSERGKVALWRSAHATLLTGSMHRIEDILGLQKRMIISLGHMEETPDQSELSSFFQSIDSLLTRTQRQKLDILTYDGVRENIRLCSSDAAANKYRARILKAAFASHGPLLSPIREAIKDDVAETHAHRADGAADDVVVEWIRASALQFEHEINGFAEKFVGLPSFENPDAVLGNFLKPDPLIDADVPGERLA